MELNPTDEYNNLKTNIDEITGEINSSAFDLKYQDLMVKSTSIHMNKYKLKGEDFVLISKDLKTM